MSSTSNTTIGNNNVIIVFNNTIFSQYRGFAFPNVSEGFSPALVFAVVQKKLEFC